MASVLAHLTRANLTKLQAKVHILEKYQTYYSTHYFNAQVLDNISIQSVTFVAVILRLK